MRFDPNQPHRGCEVCYEEVNDFEIFKIGEDYHDVCSPCIKNYMTAQISSGKVNKLECPHCEADIEPQLQDIVGETLYKKYERFKLNIEISTDPLRSWCVIPRCGGIVPYENKSAIEGACGKC